MTSFYLLLRFKYSVANLKNKLQRKVYSTLSLAINLHRTESSEWQRQVDEIIQKSHCELLNNICHPNIILFLHFPFGFMRGLSLRKVASYTNFNCYFDISGISFKCFV